MTKKGQVGVILLAKAFDKIPHQRLLHKLHFYGVMQSTLRWIESFLSKRKQPVLLDGTRYLEADVFQASLKEPFWGYCSSWLL